MAETEKAKRLEKTILDYVYENRDKTFSQLPFNDIDNVVLSELSYIPFEKVLSNKIQKPISLRNLLLLYLPTIRKKEQEEESEWAKKHLFLALAMLDSKRYGTMRLVDFQNVFSEDKEAQFTGMAFTASDKTLNVVFRGTDNSILGWKEDFNMIFMDETTGQRLSRLFLKRCLKKHPSRPFRVMGHSKGGVFAVYSCLTLTEKEENRLLNVYSNDGPGLHTSKFASKGYERIKDKIVHIVPKDSIIGILLHHDRISYAVDYEEGTDLFNAHDAYTWLVEGTRFVRKPRSPISYYLDASLLDLVESLPYDERKEFVGIFFRTLDQIGYETAVDIFADFPNAMKRVIGALFKEMRKDKVIGKVVKATITAFRKNWNVFSAKSKALKDKERELKQRQEAERKKEQEEKAKLLKAKKEQEILAKKVKRRNKDAKENTEEGPKEGVLLLQPVRRR